MQHKITFFFDENFPSVLAKAIDVLTSDDIKVFSTVDKFGAGIKDIELIPLIADQKGILITKDRKMASRKAERELLDNLKVSTIFFQTANQKFWELVNTTIKYWPALEKEAIRLTKNDKHFFANLKARSGFEMW